MKYTRRDTYSIKYTTRDNYSIKYTTRDTALNTQHVIQL